MYRAMATAPPQRRPAVLCWIAAFVGVVLATSGCIASAGAGTLASWVELVGPGNSASVRVVTDSGTSCPALASGQRELAMQVRAEPGPLFAGANSGSHNFPIRVCELTAPQNNPALLLDGQPLPVPRADPKRVVVLGDTGCRIKQKKHGEFDTQDCNNEWPYTRIAHSAAETQPDLVIHVGDYLYREVPCPAGNTACANSPSGDSWAAWNADFFQPSAPLLRAAPWIMVRGNHEICSRAGDGWFRFLANGEPPAQCQKFVPAFGVTFGGLGFIVLDSAEAADPDTLDEDEEVAEARGGSDDLVATLTASYEQARVDATGDSWLVSHRPFNAVRRHKGNAQVVDNTVLQDAIGRRLPPAVKMIVSGHIHLFEALSFGDGDPPRAAQLVVGTGGTELAKKPDVPSMINGAPVTAAHFHKGFGYMRWDRHGALWNGTLLDTDGNDLVHCTLSERTLACKKAH